MKFVSGELSFNASVAEVGQTTSAASGSQLTTMTIQFRIPKPEQHEQALEAAAQRRHGGLFSTDETQGETEWRVLASDFTYVGTEPWGMHHHTWQIEQVERVACTALVLGGDRRLAVYDYREAVSDEGVLRFAARAVASDEDLAAIAAMHLFGATVDVVREGVSPEPRRMRLDSYVWGQGAHGQAVALVCSDLAEPRVTLETPPVSAVSTLLETTLAVLHDRGVLPTEALDELRTRARDTHHATRQAPAIDAWPL